MPCTSALTLLQDEEAAEEPISLLTPYEYGRKRKAQDQNSERKPKRTKGGPGTDTLTTV